MTTKDYHNELYGCLQNRLNIYSVKKLDEWIVSHENYQIDKHHKKTKYRETQYETICTYIRNEIDHPPINGLTFNEQQLKTSIDLLRKLSQVDFN